MKKQICLNLTFFFATALAASPGDAIRKKINEHIADIKACSPEALKLDVNTGGKVVIKWKIDDEGTASEATLDDAKTTLKSSGVQTCLVDKIYSWKFPPAPQGQYISASFPFSYTATPAPKKAD
jgi:hypothetical protein